MKKYPSFLILFLFTSLLFPQSTVDTSRITIELKDGSTLIGTVADEDSLSVHFVTGSGVSMTIPHHLIRFKFPMSTGTKTEPDSLKKPAYAADPNRTRLLLMPTARPIGAGRGYFSAYELFFPSIALGVGNSVSIAGGMSLIPGSSTQLLYFAPKVSVLNSRSISLAVGGLYYGAGDDGTSMLYAAGTFGNERASLTLLARIPTEQEQNSLFVVGGELQTSDSFKLISENWIFDDYIIYGFGFRFFSGKLAADLGFFRSSTQSDNDGFPFFPWLGFAYNFGTPAAQNDENREPEVYHPVSLRSRISYSIFLLGNDEKIKQALNGQGYNTYSYSGGLFSSGERTSSGSGVFIQIEHPAARSLFVGFTYSSVGKLIGTGPRFSATKYDYQMPYYSNVYLSFSKTIATYAAHIAYSTVNNGADASKQSITVGAGVGQSSYTTTWEYNAYYGSSVNGSLDRTGTALTGLLFLSLEQRITENVSIGIDGSYLFMPDVSIGMLPLYSGTYLDTSVYPNVQKSITVKVDPMTTNFSYGKIGVSIGVNL